MRGGALAILIWATINLVLFIGNWIWDAKPVNAAEAGFAVLIIYATGVGLWLAGRESIRPGPPEPRPQVEAVPQASLAAVLVGLSTACILFGFAWSTFLVYFGAGLLLAALARLAIEVRSERISRREAERL
jgi:hypothetical protein